MHGVFFTSRTILFQLHPAGIITSILFARIIPLLAFCTFQGYNRADTFLFRHVYFTMVAPLAGTTMLSFLKIDLLNNLGDHTRADRQTTFSDGEL